MGDRVKSLLEINIYFNSCFLVIQYNRPVVHRFVLIIIMLVLELG